MRSFGAMQTNGFRACLRWVIYGMAVLWVVGCTSDDKGGPSKCEPGTERCPCNNGACDAGLACLSEVCVRSTGGSGGGTNAGSGGTAPGGNAQGGSGGSAPAGAGTSAGGSDSAGMSGSAAGGSGTSGAGGAAGTNGSGGSAGMCTADTQKDPKNCGKCGKVCRYELWGRCNDACCQNGACLDGFGECIRESDGFATCAEYCVSIGEQCVQQGCGTNTYRAWSAVDTCERFTASIGDYNDPCDSPIDFGGTIRCCCTDHAP